MLGHVQNLGCGFVPLLGLDIAKGPLGQHPGRAGQVPVASDNIVEFRTVEEIEVHFPVSVGIEIGAVGVIIEFGSAVGGGKNAITAGGQEERNGDFHIGLVEILGRTPQVQQTFRCLAKTKDVFAFLELQMESGMAKSSVKDSGSFVDSFFNAIGGDHFCNNGVFVDYGFVGIEVVKIMAFVIPFPEQQSAAVIGIADRAAGAVYGGGKILQA